MTLKTNKEIGGAAMAEKETKKENDNVIFVGKKGTMAYVLAVVTQMNQGVSEVVIKARGRAISRAVDVAEIVRNKFVTDAKIDEIKIATEEVTAEDGKTLKVSAMEIKLKK